MPKFGNVQERGLDGRRPRTNKPYEAKLRLLVSGRCTHTCPFCHNEGQSKRAPEVDVSALTPRLELLRRMFRRITLSGGEPLQATILPELVRTLDAYDFDITIDTAGNEIDQQMDVFGFVAALHISIMSLVPEHFLANCNGSVTKKLASLVKLRERYPTLPITINVPFVDRQHQSSILEMFLDLAQTLGVSIKLISELKTRRRAREGLDCWEGRWDSVLEFLDQNRFVAGTTDIREVEYVNGEGVVWQLSDIPCVKTSHEYGDGSCFLGMDLTINTDLSVQLCRWQSNSVGLDKFLLEQEKRGSRLSELIARDATSCPHHISLPRMARAPDSLARFVFVPHSQWPKIGASAKESVSNLLERDEVSYFGRNSVVRRLERAFEEFTSAKYCISLNSGSSALFLAYDALGWKDGAEVIVPAYSYPGAVSALLMLGARVKICDVDSSTGNVALDSMSNAVSDRTRGALITHFWGCPAEIEACIQICRRVGADVTEDASHAFGTRVHGQHVGTFGRVGCFSLQANKTVWGGEGGLLVTNDREIFERVTLRSSLRDRVLDTVHTPANRADWESGRGAKFKIHPLAAALALDALQEIDGSNRVRRNAIDTLQSELGTELRAKVIRDDSRDVGYYGVKLLLDAEIEMHRDSVLEKLIMSGLKAKLLDIRPIPRINFFANNPNVEMEAAGYPGANSFYRRAISLPGVSTADEELIRYYGRIIRETLTDVCQHEL